MPVVSPDVVVLSAVVVVVVTVVVAVAPVVPLSSTFVVGSPLGSLHVPLMHGLVWLSEDSFGDDVTELEVLSPASAPLPPPQPAPMFHAAAIPSRAHLLDGMTTMLHGRAPAVQAPGS